MRNTFAADKYIIHHCFEELKPFNNNLKSKSHNHNQNIVHCWAKLIWTNCETIKLFSYPNNKNCSFFQPPLRNHGNILAHLVYVIYSIKSRFCHWGIRKGHNLWVWLCNQSQPGVHCVLCLLGEEVILADYHGTPCCCYTEAELWGSHGSPLSGTRLLLLLSPLSLQLLHKYLMVFKRWGMRQ